MQVAATPLIIEVAEISIFKAALAAALVGIHHLLYHCICILQKLSPWVLHFIQNIIIDLKYRE